MRSLILKEINAFLNSLIGTVVITVFLLTISLFLWIFPDSGFGILESGQAQLDPLFAITPWVYLLLIPAITMRLFSEERRAGTLELLLTRPLTEFQVVFAKFVSGLLLVLISLLPTLVYVLILRAISLPAGNIDSGAIMGSYLGLTFLGAAFVAVGLFASSVSENQVVAFIVAFFLCLFLFTGLESLSVMLGSGPVSSLVFDLGIQAHYLSMSRGVIDSRDVVYFISMVALFLVFTRTLLESRKW